MRIPVCYCLVSFAISALLLSCGSQETSRKDESDLHGNVNTEGETNSLSVESTEEGEKHPKLSPEEQYDYVFSFFADKGTSGKSRHSATTEATYHIAANKEENKIQFIYASEDKTQGVLLSLERNGHFGILVNVRSQNEAVIGSAEMDAADYTYGYEFSDFKYQSEQKDWDYAKFRLRANAYVRDTMLYADSMLEDNLGISLNDLGFSSWKNPGLLPNGFITEKDIAGMWDYQSKDEKISSSKLYLTEDKVYWCGYEKPYADVITASDMQGEEYLLSQNMVISLPDTITGEIVICDDFEGNKERDRAQYRRYIYKNAEGVLCMRVESVLQGMSDDEDGKIYVKEEDSKDTAISPETNYPLSTEKNDNRQNDYAEEPSEHSSGAWSKSSTYQSILEEYTSEMEKAVPGLIREYKSEAAGISDITRLAEICNDKVGELAEICNEGVSEMAELMQTKGDSYETYEEWAGKLMDIYTDIAGEIQDAYLESASY